MSKHNCEICEKPATATVQILTENEHGETVSAPHWVCDECEQDFHDHLPEWITECQEAHARYAPSGRG